MTRPGQWVAGQSGNPNGRPLGARQKIAEKLLADIAEVWEASGKSVLEKLATEDPAALARIAYGLLPKELLLNVQQSGPGVNAEQWALVRDVLLVIERATPEGTEPAQVLDAIEHGLRSHFAKAIEGATS